MSEKAKIIQDAFDSFVAINMILFKMTRAKAEMRAHKIIVDIYGAETIRKELFNL